MTQFESDIDNILSRLSNDESLPRTKNALDSFHIFDLLINEFSPELGRMEQLKMIYNIHLYERCLNLYKARDINSGQVIFDLVEIADKKFSASVNYGMTSLYLAMSAYRDSVKLNYECALDKLKLAIKNAEKQGLIFPIFLTTIGEQWLNIVRVHIKNKDYCNTLDQFNSLIKFALMGIYHNEKIQNIFVSLNPSLHRLMIHHIINSVDSVLGQFHSTTIRYDFYRDLSIIFDPPCKSLDPNTTICLKLIKIYHSNGDFVGYFKEYLDNVMEAPTALRSVLFNLLVSSLNSVNYEYNGNHSCSLLQKFCNS